MLDGAIVKLRVIPSLIFIGFVAVCFHYNRVLISESEDRPTRSDDIRVIDEVKRREELAADAARVRSASSEDLKQAVKGCQKAIQDKIGKAAFSGVYFPGLLLSDVETIQNVRVGLGVKFSGHQVLTSKEIEPVEKNFRYLNYENLNPDIVMVASYLADSFSGLKTKLKAYTCGLKGLDTIYVNSSVDVTLN